MTPLLLRIVLIALLAVPVGAFGGAHQSVDQHSDNESLLAVILPSASHEQEPHHEQLDESCHPALDCSVGVMDFRMAHLVLLNVRPVRGTLVDDLDLRSRVAIPELPPPRPARNSPNSTESFSLDA